MGSNPASLVAIGLSHHTAPVAVRERFALSDEQVVEELARIRERDIAREAFYISTCNRVELYAVPMPGRADDVWEHLVLRHGSSPGDGYFFRRQAQEAVQHLFRVASSLDSLVVGEPQILGQVKDALRVAEEAKSLGTVLHRLAQRSLSVAKRVRTHTDIGRHNVGIGNAGVSLARQIFSTLKGRRVLLVGVGEMGRQVARAMLNNGVAELLVANRTFSRAVDLAAEHGGTPVAYERVAEYLGRVDIVITATGSTTPIIHASDVRAALKRRRYRPLFLVDLSVPRNIAVDVERLDQAYLFNVDDLTSVMDRSRAAREAAAQDAERMVAEEAQRFLAKLAVLEVNDELAAIAQWAEHLRTDEVQRSRKLLASLDDQQREAVDAMTRALVKKLLHAPLGHVRTAAREGDDARLQTLLDALGPARAADNEESSDG
jgi:glutamyl-tRNA reductase